jgi:hypothetical protein
MQQLKIVATVYRMFFFLSKDQASFDPSSAVTNSVSRARTRPAAINQSP